MKGMLKTKCADNSVTRNGRSVYKEMKQIKVAVAERRHVPCLRKGRRKISLTSGGPKGVPRWVCVMYHANRCGGKALIIFPKEINNDKIIYRLKLLSNLDQSHIKISCIWTCSVHTTNTLLLVNDFLLFSFPFCLKNKRT